MGGPAGFRLGCAFPRERNPSAQAMASAKLLSPRNVASLGSDQAAAESRLETILSTKPDSTPVELGARARVDSREPSGCLRVSGWVNKTLGEERWPGRITPRSPPAPACDDGCDVSSCQRMYGRANNAIGEQHGSVARCIAHDVQRGRWKLEEGS